MANASRLRPVSDSVYIYGIKDSRAKSYIRFFLADSDVIAERSFASSYGSDPYLSDFSLFYVGEVRYEDAYFCGCYHDSALETEELLLKGIDVELQVSDGKN